ncbi:MAG: methyltransferase [Deltaproteobacteria bacterium]|nr:methyltransferase [Deltaproteobacteria bacterium]
MDATTARAPRRPPGWKAPGPPPTGAEPTLGPDETVSYLTGDWRILQRRDGHRWSLDDLVTAFVAREVIVAALGRAPRTALDLGTGTGSVALMLAWSFPEAEVTGVEAQAISADLARRSIAMNGARVRLVEGDLRGHRGAAAELVTGTPPYFDDPDQPRSSAVQKGPCRFEDRGGVADYLAAAARHVAPGGRVVVCHASRQRARVVEAFVAGGWTIERLVEVVPKVGRDALVDVLVGRRDGAGAGAGPSAVETLVVRDADDQWTPAFSAVRAAMGLPPRVEV